MPILRGIRRHELVARQFERLPSGFVVLHGVPLRRGRIDHVVVGPTGVFTIQIKHWLGTLYPKEGRLHHGSRDASRVIDQGLSTAMEARRTLETAGQRLWVEAVVVITRAEVLGEPLTFRRVTVLSVGHLPEHLQLGVPCMDEGQVRDAVEALTAARISS